MIWFTATCTSFPVCRAPGAASFLFTTTISAFARLGFLVSFKRSFVEFPFRCAVEYEDFFGLFYHGFHLLGSTFAAFADINHSAKCELFSCSNFFRVLLFLMPSTSRSRTSELCKHEQKLHDCAIVRGAFTYLSMLSPSS